MQPDACDPGKTALVIGGTAADDIIRLIPQGNDGAIKVLLNGISQGTFNPTGHVIVYGQAGNDDIEIAGSIDLPAILQGDAGNDRLKAGSGPSVLLGGSGDDSLIGSNGRAILIGGDGSDRLVGGPDDDILIGGTTAFDDDHHAFCDLLEKWARTDLGYLARINLLSTGASSFTTSTVFDDGEKDTLTGSSGSDWYLIGPDDKVQGSSRGEIITSLKPT